MTRKLPYQRLILANGLTLLFYPMGSVQSVFATIYTHTGAVFEDRKNNGISHFTEHLIHQGTHNFPQPRALSERLESEGMIENGLTDSFKTLFWIKSPDTKIKKALEFLSELIFFSTLPKERMNHVRQTLITEYQDFWQKPGNQFEMSLWRKRFDVNEENHPYKYTVFGLPKNIDSFTWKEIVAWKEHFYQPDNMVLSLAGNLSGGKIVSMIEKLFTFGKMRKPIEEPKFKTGGYSDFFVYHQKDKREQIRFLLSFPAFGWREVPRCRRLTLILLGEILGRGPVSRLLKVLREKESLVYSVNSRPYFFPWKGEFLISGSTSRKNLPQVMELIRAEIEKLVKQGFLEKEVKRGKNILNSINSFRFESPEKIAHYLASEEFSGEGVWLPEDYIAEEKKITKKELNQLAKTVFNFSKLNLGLLGKLENKEIKKVEKIFQGKN